MKERSFYSNLFFSLGLNLLVKPAAIFIIDAAVQNRVGDAYGIYFAFFNLSLILSILFDLGINNLNIKLAAQDLEQAKKRVSSILVLRIFLLVLYISALVALKFLTSISWLEYKLVLIFGINQFLIANIAFFRSYFAGLHWFRFDAFISVLDRLLLIGTMGYLLYVAPLGLKFIDIEIYAIIQLLCYALTFLIAGIGLVKKVNPSFLKPDFLLMRSMIKEAFPYALLIILMTLYTRSDALILKNFAQISEVSFYAQAYRLIDALYMFAMVFAGLLFPMFAKQIKNDPKQIEVLTLQASQLLLGASLIFVVFALLNGSAFLDLFYENTSVLSGEILFYLSLAFFGMASNLIYGSLLTANGSLKILNLSSIGGVVLNLLLNYWLIQMAPEEMGALAAAKVAAITQLTVALIQRFYCYRLFHIRLPKSLMLRFLGLLLMLILFYVGVWVVLFSSSISISSSSIIVLYAIVSIALLFLFGFVDLKEIRKLLQKREAMK
ncbi:MAG: hypothetical protein RLZZ289_973 [Bacteroidota bacterium]|jgi:O-antigen/teichoic acid export membrane protein